MFERFTEKAIKSVLSAHMECRRLGQAEMGPACLFLGLIENETTIAGKVLNEAGLVLESARQQVEKLVGHGDDAANIDLPFSSDGKNVLVFAWYEARKTGVNYIGTEHLLLGLLDVDCPVIGQVLGDAGTDARKLRTAVFEKLQIPETEPVRIEEISVEEKRVLSHAPGEPAGTIGRVKSPVTSLAENEARRLGHNFIGTEQILLGLIADESGVAGTVLKALGVTLEAARKEVEKIIGRGSGFVANEVPWTPRAKRVLELSLRKRERWDATISRASTFCWGCRRKEMELGRECSNDWV